MDRLTKNERMEVDEMLKAITSAERRLAAGDIKPSEHEAIIRSIRERQNLMRIRKINSLTTPIAELSQEEYNRAYSAGYQSGFNEGLRIRLTRRTTGIPQS
jgi:flagellar biosynthesis/type III secretory pathway protein FliH